MHAYDADLLAAIKTAPQSIDDVLATMAHMDAILPSGDGLKWFHGLYREVTEAVHTRVLLPAGFSDPAWLSLLDVKFAQLYFGALAAFLKGAPTPSCWRVMFAARDNSKLARIQFALAGINAHINHDLPLALVTTCQASNSTPVHGGTRYADFTALNSTLDGIVEPAKKTLMVGPYGESLPAITHVEDLVAAWKVSAAREASWISAEVLWQLRTLPALSTRYELTLDGLATVASKSLLVTIAGI